MRGDRSRKAGVLLACALAATGLAARQAAPARGQVTGAGPTAIASRAALAAGAAAPVFAYYYIWFNHSSWGRAKKDLPLAGTYSSSDPAVLRRQVQQAESAGITGFIVSWKDTPLNDFRLRLLMRVAAAEHFKLAMIYQGLDFYRNPLPTSRVAADFVTFRDKFAGNPVFYRVDGKPLTIWSGTWAYSHADVARVTGAVRPQLLVLATEKNVAGIARIANVTDGDAYYWSSVNPATDSGYQAKLVQMGQAVHRAGKYWIAPFAPGFDSRMIGGRRAVPRNGGRTLRTEYKTAARSYPNMLGLISWNEFTENSYVEPSANYGYQSLAVLRQLRGIHRPLPVSQPPPAATTFSPWPNVIRLSAFALALVLVAGAIICRRRRHLSRRSGHRATTH